MKRNKLQNQRTPPLEKTRARLEMVRDRLVLDQAWRGQENFSPDISSYWKSVRVREKATRSTTSSKAITNNQGSPACLWNINIAGRHTPILQFQTLALVSYLGHYDIKKFHFIHSVDNIARQYLDTRQLCIAILFLNLDQLILSTTFSFYFAMSVRQLGLKIRKI